MIYDYHDDVVYFIS